MTQSEFFAYVIDVLEELNIHYMITGSVASMAYGEPRLTLDMDIVIDLQLGLVQRFCGKFGPDFYADSQGISDAVRQKSHFNIIHISSGSKVDFFPLKKDTTNQEMFKRRHRESFDEKRVASFSSPEDIIVNKLIYYKKGESEKHLRDIRGMLAISGDKLDISYVDKKTKELGLYQYWEDLKSNFFMV